MTSIVDRSGKQRTLLIVGVTVCVLSFAGLAFAGQQGQEGSIIGQATDESGAILPGVTVTATSPALQVPQLTDVTNERGEYRLTPLPIGNYVVVYTLSGFQTVRRENIRLSAGFSAKIDVTLKVGALSETVTVSGAAPVVDVTSTAGRTQLTRETLDVIPTSRSGINSALVQTPGVRTNLDFGSGAAGNPTFRTFGQDTESSTSIEGVVTTSPKTNSNGSGNYFDYSAIEETTVQTVGNDADSPTSGVQLNAILKSGGNQFHGGFFGARQSPALQSDNIDDTLRNLGVKGGNPVKLRWETSGDIGGRIVPNKLWFYTSVRVRQEKNQILAAFMPDGSPVISPNLFEYSTTKGSYQMTPSVKVIGFYQGYHAHAEGAVSQFVPWASRQISTTPLHTSKLEFQVAKGNKFFSAQYGIWTWSLYRASDSLDVTKADQLTNFVSGMNFDAGPREGLFPGAGPTQSTEARRHAKGVLSWDKPSAVGNHDFKVGFEYSRAFGDRKAPGRGPTGNYVLTFRNGVPSQFNALAYPVEPFERVVNFSSYGEDSWTIARRLTLNVGLRYSNDQGLLPGQCRSAAPAPLTTVYPATCYPEKNYKTFNSVVPRLHAAYDVTGDGKTVIKGGWGRFSHRWYSDETNLANDNVFRTTVFAWHDNNSDGNYQDGEVNFDLNGPDFVFTTVQTQIASPIISSAAIAHGVPNLNLKQQGQDEFSLAIERQLIPNLAVRATGIYTHTFNTYRVQNNLRPYSSFNIPITQQDPGPDNKVGTADDPGRSITFYEYPAALTGDKFQQSMIINDSNADQTYKSFEVAVSKRLSNRWLLLASYSTTKVHVPFVSNLGGTFAPLLATYDPNAEIFASRNTWEWTQRVTGAYTFPWSVQVSANFDRRSGEPWARTVNFAAPGQPIPTLTLNVEPIGTRRFPTLNIMSLRVEKAFIVRPGQKLALRMNVYNALNGNTTTAVTQLSGGSFLKPTTIMPPRIAELNLQYSF